MLICASLPLHAFAFGGFNDSGDRILTISIVNDKSQKVSNLKEVQEALKYGGHLMVNREVIEMALYSDEKLKTKQISGKVYCNDGKRLECSYNREFIINAIGGFGWKFHSLLPFPNIDVIFTKAFD